MYKLSVYQSTHATINNQNQSPVLFQSLCNWHIPATFGDARSDKTEQWTTPLLPPALLSLLRVDNLHASPAALTPHYKIAAAALHPHATVCSQRPRPRCPSGALPSAALHHVLLQSPARSPAAITPPSVASTEPCRNHGPSSRQPGALPQLHPQQSSARSPAATTPPCCHKKADTRIFVHARDATIDGSNSIIIKTNDTDVLYNRAWENQWDTVLPCIHRLWYGFVFP